MIQFTNFILMAGGNGQGSPMMSFFFIGGMILVFWMFMIRPQAQKAKKQTSWLNDLQKGDKVVTIAGIHGTVNKVNEDGTLQLEVNPGSYLKIEKNAISMEWSMALNKPAAATK